MARPIGPLKSLAPLISACYDELMSIRRVPSRQFEPESESNPATTLYECDTCEVLFEREENYNNHISDPLNCKFKSHNYIVEVKPKPDGKLEFKWNKKEEPN